MKSSANRIASLDGLRTVSIVFVIVGHVFHVLGLGELGNLGNLGVRIFFVISGFLITGLLLREIDKTSSIDLLKFYYRRTLRIFPPYYFYLLFVFIAGFWGAISVPNSSILLAAGYMTDYINPANWYVGHTWSLAVEEQFYLILPGLLLVCGVKWTKRTLIGIVVLLPILRLVDFQISGPDQIWVLKGFHANSDALAIGCLLMLFRTTVHSWRFYRYYLDSRIVVLLPAVVFFFNIQYDHPHIFFGVSITMMNIAIVMCIDWAVENSSSIAGRFLNSHLMVKIGTMSYSIYLWQQPFFNPIEGGLLARFPYNFIGLATMTIISYLLVERMSLNVREKWEPTIFPKNVSSITYSANEKSVAAPD